MSQAVLVDSIRTPLGKYGGSLSSVRPDDLLALLLKAMVEKHRLDAGGVEDFIAGCANQAGEDSRNVARMAWIAAGLPFDVPAQTVNRLCGSSMQAVINAALSIETGNGELFLAGGVESMSRGPWVIPKSERAFPFGNLKGYDSSLGWRFPNPAIHERVQPLSMGETAEAIFGKYRIPRDAQDAFALGSHRKAVAAWEEGLFAEEVVPVNVRGRKGVMQEIDHDEGPRADSSIEALSKLRPAFKKDGVVTAGNSCPMSDGAALCLLMTEEKARSAGHESRFRLAGHGLSGIHPDLMGLGPVEASRKALKRAGLKLSDIDVVEINEAFAVQVLACARELDLDPERVNANGGAIALGHPLGCSGARIIGTMMHQMKQQESRYGLATMCIGLGQGIATVWERIG